MKQVSFGEAEVISSKPTRRSKFLDEMECLVPWTRLEDLIAPIYPVAKAKGGRPAIGLAKMLRLYVAQHCLGLSDEGIEDAVYDSVAVRRFVGISLDRETSPDATTVLRFRHVLERHQMPERILREINAVLREHGLRMSPGSLVDATIIAGPSSTKNEKNERDPDMHQTKKGEQYHFGLKAHVAADSASGVVEAVVVTAANVHELTVLPDLIDEGKTTVHADAGYLGAAKRPDLEERPIDWLIAARRGKIKKMADGPIKEKLLQIERMKASIRARVEHSFHVVKNLFRHRKARYRGLAKNAAHLTVLFAFANLVLTKRKRLCSAHGPF
jgi:transposase, IS5 family